MKRIPWHRANWDLCDEDHAELLGCSVDTIRERRGKEGRQRWRRKPWTAEDDAVLARDYPTEDVEVLAGRLERSVKATMNRASGLGISRVVFSPKQGGGS